MLMMDSIYAVNPPSTIRLEALDNMAAGEKSKNELLTLLAMKEALRVPASGNRSTLKHTLADISGFSFRPRFRSALVTDLNKHVHFRLSIT